MANSFSTRLMEAVKSKTRMETFSKPSKARSRMARTQAALSMEGFSIVAVSLLLTVTSSLACSKTVDQTDTAKFITRTLSKAAQAVNLSRPSITASSVRASEREKAK